MKHLMANLILILFAATTVQAAQTKPSIFSVSKSRVSERMYLYIYCLTVSPETKDVAQATGRCNYILDKSNPANAQGLGEKVSVSLNSVSTNMKDMLNCLKTEADNSSTVNDSTAVSICENLVTPTDGLGLIL